MGMYGTPLRPTISVLLLPRHKPGHDLSFSGALDALKGMSWRGSQENIDHGGSTQLHVSSMYHHGHLHLTCDGKGGKRGQCYTTQRCTAVMAQQHGQRWETIYEDL
jgi:hypothetical protein